MRRSKINTREETVDYMNCNNKRVCINHSNDINCSISSVSKKSNNEAHVKKDFVGAFLSGQSIKWSDISRLRNCEKSSFQKFEESVQRSSQCDERLCSEIPLLLCSKDEIRKLAESVRTDWKENYRPLQSCYSSEKPIRSSEFRRTSVVNCSVKEAAVDTHKKGSFDIEDNCRGLNAKIPLQEVLHILDSSSFNDSSRISAHQVGALISSNNLGADILLTINGRFSEQQIARGLTKEREISSNHQKKCFPSMGGSTESSSPTDSLEARQPSPVSVLESPLERKRVAADPKELQMQLGLLKHELDGSYELPQILYTEKEPLHLIQEINLEFADEEERDFSYLLDMLIDSGFHSASNQKRLLRLCYEPDSPVRPRVFSNLEKKYKTIARWSRSERKLLFDLINSILTEILSPCMDLRPWVKNDRNVGPMWGPEGLVEKVWQILARKRQSLPKGDPQMKVFDMKWIELDGNMDLVGREIERRIKDELIEELVSELLME